MHERHQEGKSWKIRLWRNIPARWAFFLLLGLALMSLIGPWISPYAYTDIHLEWKNTPPGSRFWFGSDELGRDVFTRLWWGARISLFIGIAAAFIDACIGVVWGTVAAYFGGKVDNILMRIADILYSIPYLLVVILLTVIRKTGLGTLLIAMTLTGWINMARIARGQMLQLNRFDYVIAAQTAGASFFRIAFRHLLPNAMGPILATMTLTIPVAIFTEAFLSFVGLGIQAPAASWGVMINDGLPAMQYYPWRLFFPSLLITLTMLSFNILGNGLRDALDPRLRR